MRRSVLVLAAALWLPSICAFSSGPLLVAGRPGLKHACGLNKQQGVCGGMAPARGRAGGVRGLAALGGTAELKAMLRNYGLAAVATHFAGWVVTMTTLVGVFHTLGPENLISFLPDAVRDHIDVTSAMSIVELQMALGVTELVGPLRLGVTVALTPKVSDKLRQYPVTRDMEAIAIKASRRLARGAAGNAKRNLKYYYTQIKAYGGRLIGNRS